MLSLGIIGTSRKTDERRVPVHPRHLSVLSQEVRNLLTVESGYGQRFGVSDDDIAMLGIKLASRKEVISASEVLLLFKPVVDDLREMRPGQILWGCPHFVLDPEFTQAAIDSRISSITIEGMRHHTGGGDFSLFVFHRVCEVAGYASVRHALQLVGKSGGYGRQLKACVIGYGSTGRGAVAGLMSDGINDVTVLTERPTSMVDAPPNGSAMRQYQVGTDGEIRVDGDGVSLPIGPFLNQFDVVVNCILQNPITPKTFMRIGDLEKSAPGSLVVDVSCDTRMGFEWASPTTFAEPLRMVASSSYYAVDHSPSLYWDSASEVISEALLPFVDTVLNGPAAWEASRVIAGATEMKDGHLLNQVAITYQGRATEYPHPRLKDGSDARHTVEP